MARIQLRQVRPHPREDAGQEETQRETQHQHRSVGDRQLRIADHEEGRAHRKQHEATPAPQAVGQPGAGQVAGEGPGNQHHQVAAGVEHGEIALHLEVGGQPGRHRIVGTLHAGRQQACQHRHAQHAGLEDQHEVIALPGAGQLGPGFLVHLGLGDIAADIQDKDRRQHAGPEQHAPCVLLLEHGIDRPECNRRQAPADGPAALHQSDRLAAVAGPDHLGDQQGTDRPFAAKAQALQHAGQEQLLGGLGEAAQERKETEPEHGQLQDPHATIFVGQDAGQPAADGRADERARRDVARLGLGHAPHQDEGGDHEGVDHVVEGIDPIADEGGKERLALRLVCFFKPHGCAHYG
ncbi:hypothetical protein D9M72_406990 [compost metagenome]